MVQVVKKREKTGRERRRRKPGGGGGGGGWRSAWPPYLVLTVKNEFQELHHKKVFCEDITIFLERMFFSLHDLVVKTIIGWGRVWYKNYAEQGGLFSPKAEGRGKWHLPDLKNSRDRSSETWSQLSSTNIWFLQCSSHFAVTDYFFMDHLLTRCFFHSFVVKSNLNSPQILRRSRSLAATHSSLPFIQL